MAEDRKLPSTAGANDIEAFVRAVERLPANRTPGSRGRLLFAMDATASREPTWDHACTLQGEMFVAAEALGGLDVRLAFYPAWPVAPRSAGCCAMPASSGARAVSMP